VKVNKVGTEVDQAVDYQAIAGQELEVYTVPMPDGSEKSAALIKGFQKGSIFLDIADPNAEPIVWNGGSYKGLQRPWVVSPAWENYAEMWNAGAVEHFLLRDQHHGGGAVFVRPGGLRLFALPLPVP
jgi:hypothetical protein